MTDFMITIRKTAVLLSLCIILLFSISFSASASDEIRFSCPQKVFLGKPFSVSISTEKKLDTVSVEWLDNVSITNAVTGDDGLSRASFLLGTDVSSDSAGSRLLAVHLVSDERTVSFSWQIKVLPMTYPEEHFSVSQEMITPPSELRSRILREKEMVRKALSSDSPDRWWNLPFSIPVEGKVTSCYGKKRVLNGTKHYRHNGLDLRAINGTPVRAVADGRVVLAHDLYFSGKSVFLHHGNGVVSIYCHLSRIDVEEGQSIAAKGLVGLSGSTGRVTGPHLHLGISLNGHKVDPEPLFKTDPVENVEHELNVF